MVGVERKGVLHVEKDLLVGPIDEPVQLDRAALVQIGAVQFIIGYLWGLQGRPLVYASATVSQVMRATTRGR